MSSSVIDSSPANPARMAGIPVAMASLGGSPNPSPEEGKSKQCAFRRRVSNLCCASLPLMRCTLLGRLFSTCHSCSEVEVTLRYSSTPLSVPNSSEKAFNANGNPFRWFSHSPSAYIKNRKGVWGGCSFLVRRGHSSGSIPKGTTSIGIDTPPLWKDSLISSHETNSASYLFITWGWWNSC